MLSSVNVRHYLRTLKKFNLSKELKFSLNSRNDIELESNNKIKNITDLYRGIIDFKKGYQPRTNVVKSERGDLVTDCHSILARWRNHFCQLLNVHGENDVRQTEIHTTESLVPELSAFEVELAIEELKSHKLPGIDQIPSELIKVGGRTLHYEVHKLITSIWKKEELPEDWKGLIIVPIYKEGNKTDCSNYRGISLLPTTYKIFPTTCCQG